MSCTVPLRAWPRCSSPVLWGGGRQMAIFRFLLCGWAMTRPAASQRASQPASTACGSNALGISEVMACFIRLGDSDAPARWSLLARLSRRGYVDVLDAAHGESDLTACLASVVRVDASHDRRDEQERRVGERRAAGA